MKAVFPYAGKCRRVGILRAFRHVHVATKGAHCRPPGPPAPKELSLRDVTAIETR